MPIPVRCPGCQASFKAPDQFAGKKAKCAKCGQSLLVPGNPGAVAPGASPQQAPPGAVAAGSPAAPPTPKRPAPPQPAPASTRLPLLTYDDLKVPGRLRKSIDKELAGEEMLWLGRPTPGSLLKSATIGMIVGVVLTLATLGGMIFGYTQVTGTVGVLVVSGVGGMVLLTMALPMATMPIWVRWLINYRDCYVLTPTRAIVFDNEKILWATPKPYTGEELADRHLTVKEDGSGSIVFGSETVRTGVSTSVKTRTQNTPDGGKKEIMTIKRRETSGEKPVGFIDIEEVEAVEAMLRAQFRLGPPAGKDVA